MFKLFFVGFTMGVADLVPGISGGTIAFLSGIYERLLTELKALSIKNVSWGFFIPLGLGMGAALLSCAHLFAYLLQVAQVPLYAFFFGVVLCSVFFCIREEKIKTLLPWGSLALGAIASFFVTGQVHQAASLDSPFGLVIAGMCGAIAMLLPGVSGCYVLHLLGVYPLIVVALTAPLSGTGLSILLPVACGIAIGILISSRVISYLIENHRSYVFPFFIGCMVGGLHSLTPSTPNSWLVWAGMAVAGFISFVLMRLALKKAAA